MSDDRYGTLRHELARLNDPEARFELGEDARRAQLAGLADRYLLELLDGYERLERVLVPKLAPPEHATPDDPHGAFGAPGMMGG